MNALELTLPWPPSNNTYYRNAGAKTLISAKGREYAHAVGYQVLMQRGAKHLQCRLNVHLDVYPPNRARRDLDNLFKAVLDSLTKSGVWVDDSQIDALSIARRSVGGMVKVRITEASC